MLLRASRTASDVGVSVRSVAFVSFNGSIDFKPTTCQPNKNLANSTLIYVPSCHLRGWVTENIALRLLANPLSVVALRNAHRQPSRTDVVLQIVIIQLCTVSPAGEHRTVAIGLAVRPTYTNTSNIDPDTRLCFTGTVARHGAGAQHHNNY